MLRDVNYLALELLRDKGMIDEGQFVAAANAISPATRARFLKRLDAIPEELHKHLLFGYANPVLNLQRLLPDTRAA